VRCGVDYDVIQIAKANTPQMVPQYPVHQATESGRGIRQPEGHTFEMVQAPTGAEC